MYTWIGAAYAVHSNTRSHNGGAIYMGHGVLHEKAPLQRLNTKGLAETEVARVSEYLLYNL